LLSRMRLEWLGATGLSPVGIVPSWVMAPGTRCSRYEKSSAGLEQRDSRRA
jgi:hypothetical protein